MDLKQNVGTAEQDSRKPNTAQNVDITSVQNVENAVATYPKKRRGQLTVVLKPLLLSLLKGQRTEWGYMAMGTKEICRSVNGVCDRSFCHFAFQHSNKTAKSWSEKRGCRNLKRAVIPCRYSYKEIWCVLQILVKEGLVKTFIGRGLDLKKVRNFKVVSSDRYRFYQFVEAKL